MTLATASAAMSLLVLAGCGSDESAGIPAPSSSPSVDLSEAPSVDAQDPAAVSLRGDWEITSEQYVLHLVEDGTFVEDFEGVTDFRTGKYSVADGTLSLVGDDGNTDKAKIAGDTLEFTLGTATRVK